MKYVYLALNWTFGVLFLLAGLVTLIESLFAGLSLIVISLLLLPTVRSFVYSKTNRGISTGIRTVAILILIMVFVVSLEQSERARESKEMAERIAALRQRNIDHFNENSAQILSEINKSFEEGKYNEVLRLSAKYLPSQNKELIEFNERAKAELAAIARARQEVEEAARRKERTIEILAKLRTIPESQYAQNRSLYSELVTYHPDNEQYKRKLDYYTGKIKEQQAKIREERQAKEKERAVRLAAFGKPPRQSPWDGSYLEVKEYLRHVANDPDSIEIDACTKVYHTEDGWLVGCDYRGRNAFGGMVRQSNWFTVVHGRVTKMHDASAYSP